MPTLRMSQTHGLRVLEAAQLLVDAVLEVVGTFPPPDPAGLRRQLSESANSVAANIAEAFGRGCGHDKLYRLRIGRGSLEETQSHIKVSWKAGYLSKKDFYRIWNLTLVVGSMLTSLIDREERKQRTPVGASFWRRRPDTLVRRCW